MRKKIEELRNREEGFTLVELLAVIVILGLIVAIAVPAIGSIMDDAKKNTADANTELIIDAARLYDVENDIDDVTGVTVQVLIDAGYLDLRGNEAGIETETVKKTADGYEYSGATP